MDPIIVKDTIALLLDLYEKGALPKADFSLTEMEGRIANHLGKDVSGKQLTAAFGALGIPRTSHRVWDHLGLGRALAQYAAKNSPKTAVAVV